MGDLQKTLGLLIAWFIPGGVALVGAFQLPALSDLFAGFVSRHAVGDASQFTVLSLAALALGLAVSSAREWCLEPLLCKLTNQKGGPPDIKKLCDPNTLAVYREIVENSYRFFQHRANLLVALLVSLAFHWAAKIQACNFSLDFGLSLLFLICVAFFAFRLDRQYSSFCDQVKALFA